MFTRTVSKPLGFLPCWYSATFSAVGRAAATVDLNPGAAWWKPSTGHYALRVLTRPSGSAPGTVTVTMALPRPSYRSRCTTCRSTTRCPRRCRATTRWTYPGLACGALIRPQFSHVELYAQAQTEAFRQATTVASVTAPLTAAAETEAGKIIGGNFITPALGALHYRVSRFTIRWVASGASGG